MIGTLVQTKHPLWLKKEHLEDYISEIFILVLMVDSTEYRWKSLMNQW